MFVPRNPFLYPSGSPGVNLAHPAAQNLRFSAVGAPAASAQGIMLALYPGGRWVKNGAVTTVMGAFGPAISIKTVLGGNNFTPNVAETPLGCYAGGDRHADWVAQRPGFWSAPPMVSTLALAVPGAGAAFHFTHSANVSSGFTAMTVGHTYFIGVSFNGRVIQFVETDLTTGQILRTSIASVSALPTTTLGNFLIGGVTTGGNSPNSNIMAAMYSAVGLNAAQMNAWALSPWDFWYPRTPFNIGKAASGVVTPTTNAPALMIGV